jgi:hemerythrin-like domain-containing protein
VRATESLSADHRLIERLITAVEAGAEMLEAGELPRPAFFLDAVRFIKEYADGTHHRKEETVLFATMGEHGMPVEGGPIGVMLHEHECGREFTADLRQAAERLAAGDTGAATAVVVGARNYAALLRQHIFKEDNILFPMASRVIPPDEQHAVMERFDAIDREQAPGHTREAYVALVERLESETAAWAAAPAEG